MKPFVAVTDNRFGDQRSDNDCSHLVRRSLKRNPEGCSVFPIYMTPGIKLLQEDIYKL